MKKDKHQQKILKQERKNQKLEFSITKIKLLTSKMILASVIIGLISAVLKFLFWLFKSGIF